MTDTGPRTITAECSFPGEPSTSYSIQIGEKISKAVVQLKAQVMETVTSKVQGNAAEDVDLMEEVIEDDIDGSGGGGKGNGKGKKRKKGKA